MSGFRWCTPPGPSDEVEDRPGWCDPPAPPPPGPEGESTCCSIASSMASCTVRLLWPLPRSSRPSPLEEEEPPLVAPGLACPGAAWGGGTPPFTPLEWCWWCPCPISTSRLLRLSEEEVETRVEAAAIPTEVEALVCWGNRLLVGISGRGTKT